MLKKSFIGWSKPRIVHNVSGDIPATPEKIKYPQKVSLFIKSPFDPEKTVLLQSGDKVRTGQKLSLYEDTDAYVISTVTGTISALSSYAGDFGQSYTAVSIDVAPEDEIDEQFGKMTDALTLDTARNFLLPTPGEPPLKKFPNLDNSIHTIVVSGVDTDVLVVTNQFFLTYHLDAVNRGIRVLRQITGIENIILVVPRGSMQGFGHIDANIKAIDNEYPATHPHIIVQEVLGQVVPAGKNFADIGVCFFSAEAVTSIGKAVDSGQIPVTKTLTFINKDGSRALVETRIGTPISEIFNAFNVTLNEKDRIILGGPFTGASVYSEAHPVQPDTDAVIVQDKNDIPLASDYPCINCGQCVRACPSKMPLNLLVRFLEAGQYEEGADLYDLYSCIECGLCSFVCVSRIPIFQHIKLAKYELARMNAAEAPNA